MKAVLWTFISALCFFARNGFAQTVDAASCRKPQPFNLSEKSQIIKNARQIISGEAAAATEIWVGRTTWQQYYECLEQLPPDAGFGDEKLIAARRQASQKALIAFIDSLGLNALNSEAKTLAALITMLSGDHEQARALAHKAVKLDAANYEPNFILGLLDSDLNSIERALSLNNGFAPAHEFKAELLLTRAATLKDEDRRAAYESGLKAIDSLLALPAPPHAEFWREQQTAIRNLLEPIETLTEKPKPAAESPVSTATNKAVSTPLQILSKPKPGYTNLARIMNTSGAVRVKVTFGANAQVKSVLVLNYLPFGLTQNAVKAAKQLTFTPATFNGAPTNLIKIVEYNFSLY